MAELGKIPGRVWALGTFLVLAMFALFSKVLTSVFPTLPSLNWGLFMLILFLFFIGAIIYFVVFQKYALDKTQAFMLIIVLAVLGFVGWKIFGSMDVGGLFNASVVNADLKAISNGVMSVFGGP